MSHYIYTDGRTPSFTYIDDFITWEMVEKEEGDLAPLWLSRVDTESLSPISDIVSDSLATRDWSVRNTEL